MERRKQIEIEEQEIRRKEKELMSTVKLPAEAEAYKVQTIAEGKRQVAVMLCSTNEENLLIELCLGKFCFYCNAMSSSYICVTSLLSRDMHNLMSIHVQI